MGQTTSLSQDELEEAFAVFSRVSAELDETYRTLQSRVAELTAELGQARSARLRELAEKERLAIRLSSLVSALPGGVLISDAAGIVRDANPQALQVLGQPLLGEAWRAVLERVSGHPELRDAQLVLANGKRYSVVSRRLDDSGDCVLLITDVSEIHQLQTQLGRRQRLAALGEMAARLAHQIRTPLSAATLYISRLAAPQLDDGERRRIAGRVGQRLDHMGKLVEGMLHFVRGGAREHRPIYLADVLRDFQSSVAPQWAAAGARLAVPPVDHSLRLLGNHEELVGALGNLAMNALESAGGCVALDLWVGALDDYRLQIRLTDDGPGVPEALRERIFDPFFTTRANGTGLGLAVVALTVADHGGEISVQGAPGGGAVFVINLPIAGEAAGAETALAQGSPLTLARGAVAHG